MRKVNLGKDAKRRLNAVILGRHGILLSIHPPHRKKYSLKKHESVTLMTSLPCLSRLFATEVLYKPVQKINFIIQSHYSSFFFTCVKTIFPDIFMLPLTLETIPNGKSPYHYFDLLLFCFPTFLTVCRLEFPDRFHSLRELHYMSSWGRNSSVFSHGLPGCSATCLFHSGWSECA